MTPKNGKNKNDTKVYFAYDLNDWIISKYWIF